MSHCSTIDVRFGECDPYGHVNHAVYATYFEVARTEALASIGLDLAALTALGIQLVITDLVLSYKQPAILGDTITIQTTVVERRRVSSLWRQVAMRGDIILVTAEVRAGVTDRTGRPTRPDPTMFERFDELVSESD